MYVFLCVCVHIVECVYVCLFTIAKFFIGKLLARGWVWVTMR